MPRNDKKKNKSRKSVISCVKLLRSGINVP